MVFQVRNANPDIYLKFIETCTQDSYLFTYCMAATDKWLSVTEKTVVSSINERLPCFSRAYHITTTVTSIVVRKNLVFILITKINIGLMLRNESHFLLFYFFKQKA